MTSPVYFVFFLLGLCLAQSGYDYNGGVSLRYPNVSCPAGTFYTATSYEANCCPNGQYASSPGGSAYCCPSSSDCGDHVEKYVKCADPAWIYCPSPDNAPIGFCCLSGWVCYAVPLEGGGHGVGCGPPGYVVGSSTAETLPTVWGAYDGPGQTTVLTSKVTVKPTTTSQTSSRTSTHTKATSATTTASPGLSTGAEAGIGVGAGVVGLAIIAGLVWFIRKARSKSRGQKNDGYGAQPKYAALGQDQQPHELSGQAARYELNGMVKPVEVTGSDVAELPADYGKR